jgi:hypothetical protein
VTSTRCRERGQSRSYPGLSGSHDHPHRRQENDCAAAAYLDRRFVAVGPAWALATLRHFPRACRHCDGRRAAEGWNHQAQRHLFNRLLGQLGQLVGALDLLVGAGGVDEDNVDV